MSLKGMVAIIMGGGKNPGADRARQLAKEGADLALHCNTSKSKDLTLQFRTEITKAFPGVHISVHAGDLGTAAAVEGLFADVLSEHKKIDIVLNTAGILLRKPTSESSDAYFAYAVFVDEQRRRCVDQYQTELNRKHAS